jgi:Amt family ammonium transporter
MTYTSTTSLPATMVPLAIFPLLLLSTFALAGVALINTGLGRSRSAAQSLLGCAAIIAVGAICFATLGTGFGGSSGHASIHAAGRSWDWIGTGPWLLHGFEAQSAETQLGLLFELMAVGMCGVIPWGAGADRLRLAAGCGCAAVLGVLIFPLAAHWTWGGGWLAQLGSEFGMGPAFADAAGGGTIHVVGGFMALAVIWIVGPRRGKFPKEGLATVIPGHNTIYVLFGCLLALAGWLGWNSAGALLWLHVPVDALPLVAVNTLLMPSAAILMTLLVTRVRFGKPDASLCANGWLAGLVTSSACAPLISPGAALFAGAVMGLATPFLVEALELALSIDDPTGAITVHGAGGLWGLLVAGAFSHAQGQLLAQLVGIAAIAGVLFPLTYGLLAALDRVVPFRVDPDGERMGMDLRELGGGAYPEFVIHRDESYR